MSTVHQFPVQRNQPPAAPEEVADALGVAIDAAVGASRHSLWLVWDEFGQILFRCTPSPGVPSVPSSDHSIAELFANHAVHLWAGDLKVDSQEARRRRRRILPPE